MIIYYMWIEYYYILLLFLLFIINTLNCMTLHARLVCMPKLDLQLLDVKAARLYIGITLHIRTYIAV